jgi:hypothetical protein
MQACAKAARSRDRHGSRGQWGDPVTEILTGGAVGLPQGGQRDGFVQKPGFEVEPRRSRHRRIGGDGGEVEGGDVATSGGSQSRVSRPRFDLGQCRVLPLLVS